MSETIITHNKNNPDVAIPMDRAGFYRKQVENFEKGKSPEESVDIIDIFIFDSTGELFIQKRSDDKAHNAGLLDKTIGGHVRFEDGPDYTVMVETVQELQVPSITLRTDSDFMKTFRLLKEYLNTVAVIKHIDTKTFELKKSIKGQMVPILNRVHLYFGVYDGSIRTVDREAKGVLLYKLEDLEKEIQRFPGIFTDDVIQMVEKYKSEIKAFIKTIQK